MSAPQIQFFGATGEVTGSCHLVSFAAQRVLLDCGLIQGGRQEEQRNREPFPFDAAGLDAVVLSHAHLDHAGRLPLLVKSGFRGPIYTHRATADLCQIMLRDSASLMERDVEWENRKRERKGLEPVEPLYHSEDVEAVLAQLVPLSYGEKSEILPKITLCLSDAGHILGSAIVELWLGKPGSERKLVFSGDLGRSGMPVLADPANIFAADRVIMESTYGDRLHRNWDDTREELHSVFQSALLNGKGNILIPAFAVGRTQEILYLFAKYYDEWELDRWQIFLDSPLAIEATAIYARNSELFDDESLQMWRSNAHQERLPNLRFCRSAEESMQLNRVHSGAIILAGSGMCTGGRIRQHFKHNIWRHNCQVIISGFQARGTLGRLLVDGASHIRLWGETIRVAAKIHTIGGLSAHADQAGLIKWYAQFRNRPELTLVHGETEAQEALAAALRQQLQAPVSIARHAEIQPI